MKTYYAIFFTTGGGQVVSLKRRLVSIQDNRSMAEAIVSNLQSGGTAEIMEFTTVTELAAALEEDYPSPSRDDLV